MARDESSNDTAKSSSLTLPDQSIKSRRTVSTEPHSRLDTEEKHLENIYNGTAPKSTESNVRYAAYASRVRTILMSAHRYVAYTSDIGESFRPVAHPYLIRGAYGVSWMYLMGDVGYEGYKAYLHNKETRTGVKTVPSVDALQTRLGGEEMSVTATAGHVPGIQDYRAVMAQRAIFQGLASMGLPAFTIHSIVKYSGRYLRNAKNTRIRSYGPIGVSLSIAFRVDD